MVVARSAPRQRRARPAPSARWTRAGGAAWRRAARPDEVARRRRARRRAAGARRRARRAPRSSRRGWSRARAGEVDDGVDAAQRVAAASAGSARSPIASWTRTRSGPSRRGSRTRQRTGVPARDQPPQHGGPEQSGGSRQQEHARQPRSGSLTALEHQGRRHGLCDRRTLHRNQGQLLRRGLPGRLHPPDARTSPTTTRSRCSTSTPRSASTATPASRPARSTPASPRTSSPTSGRSFAAVNAEYFAGRLTHAGALSPPSAGDIPTGCGAARPGPTASDRLQHRQRDRRQRDEPARRVADRLRGRVVRVDRHERHAGVGLRAQRHRQRHLAEQRHVELVGQRLAAALAEDREALARRAW